MPEDYIVYFQEDMWLKEKIEENTLEQLLTYVFLHKIEHLKLHNSDFYFPYHTATIINGLPLSILDNNQSRFLLSHQITLWHKTALLKQMPYVETAFQSERDGIIRIRKENLPVHQISLIRGNETIDESSKNSFGQSLYFAISSKSCLNEMALPYIRQLLQSGDEHLINYAKELQFHYDHHLTHDKKPDPRRKGAWKKVKRIVKYILGRK
jgi:hypothetical protein